MSGVDIALFAASLFFGSVSYQQQKKAQRRAREAAREASAQDIRLTPAGQQVPVLYGTTGAPGLEAYGAVGNNLPWVPSSQAIGSLEAGEGKKNEYFLGQYVIGAGDIEKVTDVWLGDRPTTTGELEDLVITEWRRGGTASDFATRFDSGHGGRSGTGNGERSASDRFTGLPYLTLAARHDRDNPKIYGTPTPFAFVRGRRLRAWAGIGSSASYGTVRSWSANAVRVLGDYLTSTEYGPGLSSSDLDHNSWLAAQRVADQIVQGPGSALWNTAFPAGLNQLLGTNYATWSAYFTGLGMRSSSDEGLPPSPSYPNGDVPAMRRYEFNGSVPTTRNYPAVIESILEVMPGAILFRRASGKWALSLPDPTRSAEAQSVAIIGNDDLLRPLEIIEPDSTVRINRATARFTNATQALARDTLTFPPAGSALEAQWEGADGGQRLSETIELEGINNPYAAANVLSSRILLSRRRRYTGAMRARGYLLEPGDVVRLKDDVQAVDVYARLERVRITPSLNVEFVAVEFDPLDFAWLSSTRDVLNRLTGVNRGLGQVQAVSLTVAQGLATVLWTPAPDEPVQVTGYEVAISLDDGASWPAPVRVGFTDVSYSAVPSIEAATLKARVRPVGEGGAVGQWRETVTGVFDTVLPNDGLGFEWRGAWRAGETYRAPNDEHNVSDVVAYNSKTWVCKLGHASQAGREPGTPGGAQYWDLLADRGEPGPQGDSFRWRGTWAAATTYQLRDTVSHAGSSWISTAPDNRGNIPSALSAQWDLLAEKGDQGDTGPRANDGKGFEWQGNWGTGRSYRNNSTVRDVVAYRGASYVASRSHTSSSSRAPGTAGGAAYWSLLADEGDPGPKGDSFNWRGNYSSSTTYARQDTVAHDGRSWISTADNNRGRTPSAFSAYWDLLADKGDTGAQGPRANDGKGFEWQGNWGTGRSYRNNSTARDVVAYSGASYVCLSSHTSSSSRAPGTGGGRAYWGLLADEGDPGPEGDSFRWRGNWSSAVTYASQDCVAYDGRSWIAVREPNRGNRPSTASIWWNLLADKGAKGDRGLPGNPGTVISKWYDAISLSVGSITATNPDPSGRADEKAEITSAETWSERRVTGGGGRFGLRLRLRKWQFWQGGGVGTIWIKEGNLGP